MTLTPAAKPLTNPALPLLSSSESSSSCKSSSSSSSMHTSAFGLFHSLNIATRRCAPRTNTAAKNPAVPGLHKLSKVQPWHSFATSGCKLASGRSVASENAISPACASYLDKGTRCNGSTHKQQRQGKMPTNNNNNNNKIGAKLNTVHTKDARNMTTAGRPAHRHRLGKLLLRDNRPTVVTAYTIHHGNHAAST